MEGDLRVTAAFVASRVEHAILAGLRTHAAAEEQVVQRWLDDHAAGGR
jgi:peptidyl-tRNA hydrolase